MNNFLDNKSREYLKNHHRTEKNGKKRDRIKAVLLSDKGWAYKAIAEALLLDEETVSRHVKEYLEKKKLGLASKGSKSKLNAHQTAELVDHLQKITYLKVGEICAYVHSTYGINYKISGMTSWLKSHGFSYKKPKGTPSKADPLKQEAFLQAYESLLKTTPEDEPILFGDGVHPTMATKITYGWIKRGSDKLIATTASRTRMNLMGTVNLKTMKVIVDDYKTIDSQAMTSYFEKLKVAYPQARKIHLIVDRGPYNISVQTKEAAKKNGIKLHYLPPYSPNLNPIERLWKVMNENVRNNRFFESAKVFRKSILNFFEITWPKIASSMTSRINDNFQMLKS